MKLNSLEKIYNTLKYEWPTVDVPEEIQVEAVKPIERMLELS
jgi:quinolinate synthase